jgi:hypothetical protein
VTSAQIHAIADRLAPSLRAAWMRAVRVIRARVTPDRVQAVLSAANADALERALRAIVPDAALEPFVKTLRVGMLQSLRGEAARVRVRGVFTGVSRRAVEYAGSQSAKRVTGISRVIRRAIRAEIMRGQRGDATVQQIAAAVRDIIGVTPLQAKRLAAMDITPAQRAKLAAKLTRRRAETIARTESIAAANVGQVGTWKDLQASGLLPPDARKRWVVTHDDRLCPICRPMAGQTVPIAANFESEKAGAILAPPLHPNCRCAIVLATELTKAADAA